eukprot:COSAG02_NODE_2484_length_8718_cov_11.929806_6_plen_280_part_00
MTRDQQNDVKVSVNTHLKNALLELHDKRRQKCYDQHNTLMVIVKRVLHEVLDAQDILDGPAAQAAHEATQALVDVDDRRSTIDDSGAPTDVAGNPLFQSYAEARLAAPWSAWDIYHDPRCTELMHPLLHTVYSKLNTASTQLNLLSGIRPRSGAVADQLSHLSTLALELDQRMQSDDPASEHLGVMEQEVLSGSWPLGTGGFDPPPSYITHPSQDAPFWMRDAFIGLSLEDEAGRFAGAICLADIVNLSTSSVPGKLRSTVILCKLLCGRLAEIVLLQS